MTELWPMETITLVIRAPRAKVDTHALTIAINRWLHERLHLDPMEASVTGATIEPRFEPTFSTAVRLNTASDRARIRARQGDQSEPGRHPHRGGAPDPVRADRRVGRCRRCRRALTLGSRGNRA